MSDYTIPAADVVSRDCIRMSDTRNGDKSFRLCASEWVFCDGNCRDCDITKRHTLNVTIKADKEVSVNA